MSGLEKLSEIKPFCPVHHWRMALDPSPSGAAPSYRCNYDQCKLRYSIADGYFETGRRPGDQNFLAEISVVHCQHSREHHPCIVGYTKDSQGSDTEEWRQWQCLASGCEFSRKQKLAVASSSPFDSSASAPARSTYQRHEHSLAKR
jgi:hypothetical protein